MQYLELEKLLVHQGRKAGLSWSIMTVSTRVMRSRVKYLSLRLRTLYGPLYGQSRGER